MRGNKYARKFDVTKTRKQRKSEKKRALAKTGRVRRLKAKLRGMKEHKETKQKGSHTAALMESYVIRRKQERKAEKEKELMAANGGVLPEKVIETAEVRRARILKERQEALEKKKNAGKKRAREEESSDSGSDYSFSGSDSDSEFGGDDGSDDSDSDGSSLDFSALKGIVDIHGGAKLPGMTSSKKDTAPPAKKKVAPVATTKKAVSQTKAAIERQRATPKAGTRSLY